VVHGRANRLGRRERAGLPTAYTIASDVSDGGSRGASMGLVRGGILFGFPAGVVIGGVANSPGR